MAINTVKFIRLFALLTGIVGTIAFLILGASAPSAGIGLPLMIGGPVFAWSSASLQYGFALLIQKVCEIESRTSGCEKEKP